MDSPFRLATNKQPAKNVNALAGENLSFSTIPGTRYDYAKLLLGNALRRNCASVYKLATPYDPTLSMTAGKLASKIAADLEYSLSMSAQRRGHCNDSQDQGYNIDDLDAWAAGILEWTGFPAPTASVDSQRSEDSDISEYSNDSDLTASKRADFDLEAYVGSTGFVHIECGMFSLDSSVERQAAPAPHVIVANADIARENKEQSTTEQRLVTVAKALFAGQHSRRFAWGLTASWRAINAYVFGPDDIWSSTEMDITSAEGRLAFISLPVDWSLLRLLIPWRHSMRHTSGASSFTATLTTEPFYSGRWQTADGVKGVLGEFAYVSYSGDNAVEVPELMLFQSIRSLERQAVAGGLDVGDREHAQAP
ncbi:hypothetical protein H4R27_006116 [Coemansia aciculifera]|nr:hypothetical protein H4R27_006116 [Coemansia aciculifera]